MAFTLRVMGHGAGACVDVPSKKQYMVFFCQLGKDVKNPTTYVRFPAHSYRGKRRVLGAPWGDERHIVLHGERLVIRADVAVRDQKLTVDRNKDQISTTPTAYDEHSVYWLPKIDDFAPGHGKLNPAYLKKPLAADPPLVAQLVFTKGRLGTTGVERLQVPLRKRYARRGGELRAIAREIQLELEVLDDHFVLESHPLDGSPRKRSKDMRFYANGAKTLDIVIGNEPESDIYQPVPPIVPIDVLAREAAKELDFYFQLCADPPSDPLLPRVVSRPNGAMFCTKVGFSDIGG